MKWGEGGGCTALEDVSNTDCASDPTRTAHRIQHRLRIGSKTDCASDPTRTARRIDHRLRVGSITDCAWDGAVGAHKGAAGGPAPPLEWWRARGSSGCRNRDTIEPRSSHARQTGMSRALARALAAGPRHARAETRPFETTPAERWLESHWFESHEGLMQAEQPWGPWSVPGG